ncbi:hypothetical protein C2R22_11090 [Salinigranum rubrum]|uniref:Uncharacterized protein n=1 Tax=Salinigranum rubrum TaxID=755307 RepID=A0A2I8VJQ3_9EURY|nr:hypothetical protein [Salinigranum rubrum]AUV82124.1 hypothetical protein C2R22_11090 [Salinigranum rubrum]
MRQPSRRDVVRSLAALSPSGLASCLGGDQGAATERPSTAETDCTTVETARQTATADDPTVTISDDCTAAEVPRPTDAATSPRAYPAAPDDLATSSVRTFVEAYETAYQYNRHLADNPRKIGRLNGLSVHVAESQVTVESEAEPRLVSVVVSGQASTHITGDAGPGSSTPETPTVTPLPAGHWPFESSYLVSERGLRRGGLVVECW